MAIKAYQLHLALSIQKATGYRNKDEHPRDTGPPCTGVACNLRHTGQKSFNS